jgi:RNA polymerase sigma-B factor
VIAPDDERAAVRRRFEEYHRTRDPRLRDALVEEHLRLAVHLARRFDHRGVPLDDLVQVASVGLVHAVERFEPHRGLEFSTFATPTIMGELKRYFRDKSWAVRVPRRIQELHARINALAGDLTQQLGRSPTILELSVAARTSPEEVLEAMEAAQAYRSSSLDSSGPDAGVHGAALVGSGEELLFQVDDKLLIERLLATLPPREQLMIRMRFYEEMTQSEIAERLDISQMHVSRLLARCLDRFRVMLAAERGGGAG